MTDTLRQQVPHQRDAAADSGSADGSVAALLPGGAHGQHLADSGADVRLSVIARGEGGDGADPSIADSGGEVRLSVIARGEASGDDAPALAGFIASSFSPLVAEAAARCLGAAGKIPVVPGNNANLDAATGQFPGNSTILRGGDAWRTGMVVVSASGDVATNAAIAAGVDSGARLGPLLFFQAVPNAVAGYVAARWGLTGPVVCLSPAGDALADGYAAAELLIVDGDADEVLIIVAEQSDLEGERDQALALLVSDKGVQP